MVSHQKPVPISTASQASRRGTAVIVRGDNSKARL
jgi:hypothetical protein